MINNTLILPINKSYVIKIDLPLPLERLTQDDICHIYLIKENSSTLIFNHHIFLFLEDLIIYLKSLLSGSTVFPLKKIIPLGFRWNQVLFNCSKHTECSSSCKKGQSITECLIFSLARTNTTWLYELNNIILLEISPLYPYFFSDKLSVGYKHFLKEHKPILLVTISKKNIKLWQSNLKLLKKTCTSNEKRMSANYK